MKMKLSIITVAFNAESSIKRTIQSVLNQTETVYEYIVVDGGSSDRTYEIVCSYDEIFLKKGIRFFHKSEPDKGISDAFNKGIHQATGDLIGIINADDELLPNTAECLRTAFDKNIAGVYYGNCLWVDTARGTEHISYPKHELKKLLYSMILRHPSTFVRRDVYEKYGVFDISYRYIMDEELLYRFYKAGVTFQYVDEVLTRFKAGGVSDTNPLKVFREGSRMAINNGEPLIKVKIIEYMKRIRAWIVNAIKKTALYDRIKKTKKIV